MQATRRVWFESIASPGLAAAAGSACAPMIRRIAATRPAR
jgi:hypothetical protein